MNYQEKRVEVNPKFRKELFKEHGSVTNLANKLNTSGIMLSAFKNNSLKTIPYKLFKNICKEFHISNKERDKHIKYFYTHKEICNKGLIIGRNFRKRQLKNWRKELPSVNKIIGKKRLDLEKWFESYLKLINFGCRKFKKIRKEGNKIIIQYYNYSNSKKRLFHNILPRRIKIDKDFQYFFRLWCGDRVGKGRFGVVNQNEDINLITIKYLKKIYQKPKVVLMINPNIKIPDLKINIEKIMKYKSLKTYGVYVYSQNNILFTFFDYLAQNLNTTLSVLPNKNIFFAGLFDAEGNVFLEDRCLRWSCKTKKYLRVYQRHLKDLDLYHRYDGSNFVTYNLQTFLDAVYPFIKHKNKINDIRLLCNLNGKLKNRFLNILKEVYKKPCAKIKELAKGLKRAKLYSQIRFLEDTGYVYIKEYPKKVYLTEKGLKELRT